MNKLIPIYCSILLFLTGCTKAELEITEYFLIKAGLIFGFILIVGIIFGIICMGIRWLRGFFDF